MQPYCDCSSESGLAGIALWHVLSGLLDYSILKSIYFAVPELSAKKRRRYEYGPSLCS